MNNIPKIYFNKLLRYFHRKICNTSKLHYVRDYETLVDYLTSTYPIDEAMSRAVGGHFDSVGKIQRLILEYAGLKDGSSLVDVGCGSGRTANALSDIKINYLGTDVVQKLLDYAESNSPSNFSFIRHIDLSVPVKSSSVDMICAFSVFTHLRHEESYLYLEDFSRALNSEGMIVFSFLEFSSTCHWQAFEETVLSRKKGQLDHLNVFIERNVIRAWCNNLNLEVVEFVDAEDTRWEDKALGQSIAFLRKPKR